jgi:SAM-dependent methyltransferase
MKILEIGPGTVDAKSVVFPGADTLDGVVGNPTYKASWGKTALPIESETYDRVFASHVLEHVPWYRVKFALTEAHRILKPGGELEIYVPDFEAIVRSYLAKQCGDKWRVFNLDNDYMTWVNGRIFTYGEDATELLSAARPIPQTHHKTVFDARYLTQLVRQSNFSRVKTLTARVHGKAHSVPEVGVIGYKAC